MGKIEKNNNDLLDKFINDISSKIIKNNKDFSPKKKVECLSNLSKVKTKEDLKHFCKKYDLY